MARRRAYRVVRDRWDILLVIAAGGALGSLARWAVTEVVASHSGRVPWATWVENVGGAFALGLLMVFVLDVWQPHRYVRPILAVGVLGGYTTFPTYMLDAHALLADGQVPAAFVYLVGRLIIGLIAVAAGIFLARLTVRAAQRSRRTARHERQIADHVAASAQHPAGPGSDPGPDPDPDLDPNPRRTRRRFADPLPVDDPHQGGRAVATGVGTVVPVVRNQVCPVVNCFEELVVTDTDGSTLRRWPVAARGLLS